MIFIFNSFGNFKPVKRFQNRCDVLELILEPGRTTVRARAFWMCWRRFIW